MDFKRIGLSKSSTNKLKLFKVRTGLTPNIACRLALGLSLTETKLPSLELYTDDSGQEINRHTLLGDQEVELISLFLQWCLENNIPEEERYQYFIAHINRGVELLTNRVKGLENLVELIR